MGFRVEAAAGKPSISLDIQDLRQSGPIRARSEQGIIDWLSANDHSLMGFMYWMAAAEGAEVVSDRA